MLQNELETTGDVKNIEKHDVYCVCSLLKYYYKQMEPKLINSEVGEQLRACGEDRRAISRVLRAQNNFVHQNVFYLADLLKRVAARADQNKMTLVSICQIFAPNVFQDYQQGDEYILIRIVQDSDAYRAIADGFMDSTNVGESGSHTSVYQSNLSAASVKGSGSRRSSAAGADSGVGRGSGNVSGRESREGADIGEPEPIQSSRKGASAGGVGGSYDEYDIDF